MNTSAEPFPNRRIWLTALLAAICLGIPITPFVQAVPWLIILPIAIGSIAAVAPEVAKAFSSRREQLMLIRTPREFLGLPKYRGHVALWSPKDREPADQSVFAFLHVTTRKASKTARIIRDPETGEEIYLIDTERFVSLLLSSVLPNAEQSAEFALLRALQRYGEMEIMSGDLEKFLRAKSVQEVIKADVRSGIAHAMNLSSEAVLREAINNLRTKQRVQPARP